MRGSSTSYLKALFLWLLNVFALTTQAMGSHAETVVDQTISLPSGEVFYRDSGGDDIPVVFLHAGSGNSMLWEYQIPVFTEAGYRFIAINYRGTGNGAGADSKALINDLVKKLNLPRFHLIGTAAGGGQALEYALANPGKLRSITVANSLGNLREPEYQEMGSRIRPPEFNQLPLELRELGPSYRAANKAGEARWLELSAIGREDVDRMPPLPATNASQERPQQASGPPDSVAADPSDPTAVSWTNLEKFKIPTLLMTGDADLYTPPSALRMFKAHMPDAEFYIIPEAGHSGFWENPEFWNQHVLDFIAKH